MKKKSKSDRPQTESKSRYSRRGFVQGIGAGGGALGLLSPPAEAAQAGAAAAAVAGPAAVAITLQINGKPAKLTVEPRVTLLDALRNQLDLTGAKRVCDRGTCGACTVIMNGKVVYACSVLAIDAQGAQIQTIEGISTGPKPHPVSTAFVNHDAQQCGYCTPGFIMATKGYLDRNPNVTTVEQAEQGLGGNLCRCGTYVGMKQAVLEAAKAMRGGKNA